MSKRLIALAALAWAGPLPAADLLLVAPAGVATVEPAPLEWLRQVRPREGRDVAVQANGVTLRTIEWWHPVEVRVRTESGAPLTERERADIRAEALVCNRGEVRGVAERTEANGTFVLDYDCAWLQGFEAQ